MITPEELYAVGVVGKTHGLNGAFKVVFSVDFELELIDFLIFERDGILVPFKLEEFRFFTETAAYVTLKGVGDEKEARTFFGLKVYVNKSHLHEEIQNDDPTIMLRDCKVYDEILGFVGLVTEVYDETENVLLELDHDDLIPFALVNWEKSDLEKKRLHVELPEGMLNINRSDDTDEMLDEEIES